MDLAVTAQIAPDLLLKSDSPSQEVGVSASTGLSFLTGLAMILTNPIHWCSEGERLVRLLIRLVIKKCSALIGA